MLISDDGVPFEMCDIGKGTLTASQSQPANLYAKYALTYALDAAKGVKLHPGRPVEARRSSRTSAYHGDSNLADPIVAPFVTKGPATLKLGHPVDGLPAIDADHVRAQRVPLGQCVRQGPRRCLRGIVELAMLPGDALVPRQLTAMRRVDALIARTEWRGCRWLTSEQRCCEAKGITKRFGSTVALRSVDARLDAGRCLGLVGSNGAGKSTLVSILSGLIAPDEGAVMFDGQPAPRISDVASWKSRISTVFQRSMVVPWLTVAENVFLGTPPTRSGLLDWGEMRDRTADVMHEWGFDIHPDTKCKDLSVDQLQIVEIARALATGPAACCWTSRPQRSNATGIATLFDRVHQLIDRGVAVLYISHHLEEVFEICSDVTVLRDGQVVLSAETPTAREEDLVAAMVGDVGSAPPRATVRGPPAAARRTPRAAADRRGEPRVSAGVARDVSLEVAAGERVGVTGLLSAGSRRSAAWLPAPSRSTPARWSSTGASSRPATSRRRCAPASAISRPTARSTASSGSSASPRTRR